MCWQFPHQPGNHPLHDTPSCGSFQCTNCNSSHSTNTCGCIGILKCLLVLLGPHYAMVSSAKIMSMSMNPMFFIFFVQSVNMPVVLKTHTTTRQHASNKFCCNKKLLLLSASPLTLEHEEIGPALQAAVNKGKGHTLLHWTHKQPWYPLAIFWKKLENG